MVQILLAMNQKQQFKIKNDGDKKSIFLIEIFRYTAQNFLQIFYSKAFIFVRKRLYHLVDIWVFVNEGEKKNIWWKLILYSQVRKERLEICIFYLLIGWLPRNQLWAIIKMAASVNWF